MSIIFLNIFISSKVILNSDSGDLNEIYFLNIYFLYVWSL